MERNNRLCFAENAYVLISRYEKCQSREEIDTLFSELISQANPGNGRDAYFMVMPVITMDGDNTKVDWMLYIFIADPVTGVFPRFNHMRRGYDVYD